MSIIVEPWAETYDLPVGSILKISIDCKSVAAFETKIDENYFTVWIGGWGCTASVTIDDIQPPHGDLSIRTPF